MTINKCSQICGSSCLLFLVLSSLCNAETLITPSAFRGLWISENRSRIVHNYMRMSDQQLHMSQSTDKKHPFLLNLSFDSGADKVLFPTTEGIKQGTIDGLGLQMASPHVGIFLEQMILDEDGGGAGQSKFIFSDYVVTGTLPMKTWNLSIGIIKSKRPSTQGETFTVVRSRDDQLTDRIGLFLHVNYSGIQFGSYVDQDNVKSVYSLVNYDLSADWHNEFFLSLDEDHYNQSKDRSIQLKSTFDLTHTARLGLSIKYLISATELAYTAAHWESSHINLDYIQYQHPVAQQQEKDGFNVEYFWGNRDQVSLGFGYRRNYKLHTGYYVNDYPIYSFFIRTAYR